MLESPRTVEDITEGEEPRVIIVNPRRSIPVKYIVSVATPMIFAAADHAGVPVKEMHCLYQMRNPRECFSNFATPQNAEALFRGFIEANIINFAATTLGVPALPIILGRELCRENLDWITQRRFLLAAPPAVETIEEKPVQLKKQGSRICGDLKSWVKSITAFLFWETPAQTQTIPRLHDDENNPNTASSKGFGKLLLDQGKNHARPQ